MPDPTRLKNRAEAVRKRLGLSEEVAKVIRDAAYNSYGECAPDMEPDVKSRGTIRRSTAIEIALDAGRPQQLLMRRPASVTRDLAIEFLNGDRGYQDLIDLVGPAFPYAEYEVGC